LEQDAFSRVHERFEHEFGGANRLENLDYVKLLEIAIDSILIPHLVLVSILGAAAAKTARKESGQTEHFERKNALEGAPMLQDMYDDMRDGIVVD